MVRKKAQVSEAAPAAPPSPPVALTLTESTRVIELEPADFDWASWTKREVREKPTPEPFDFEACRNRLAALTMQSHGWADWAAAKIAPILTREEAHYWWLAMIANYEKTTPQKVAAKLKPKDVTGKLDQATATKNLKDAKWFQPNFAVRPLFNLFDPLTVAELLGDEDIITSHWNIGTVIFDEFLNHYLPYLGGKELEAFKKELRPRIDPKNWPAEPYKQPDPAFSMAAAVGMPAELHAVVRSIPDKHYAPSGWDPTIYQQPQRLVFGLDRPETVQAEMRRLKLPIRDPAYLRAWLALTQFDGLDYARDNILGESHKEPCEKLVKEFARVKAPEAAPHMLELKLDAKSPGPARAWLDEQVGNAITGLIPVAAGRGKLAEAAVDYLGDAKRKGHEAFIRAALKGVPAEVAEAVRKNVLEVVEKVYPELDAAKAPGELKTALASAKPGKVPTWPDPATLPPILVGDHKLSAEQTSLVLAALQKSAPGKPEPLVATVKKHADAASLDAFAWKLFQAWQGEGYPPKEKWAMGAMTQFGGDACALKITPLIRNWPGESQHQRAVFGLECLRGIGSDLALMQLNGIAQKLKFKGLKQKATDAMEAIAKEKGLTRAQLEDRVVPDCDLDERGQHVFDFGSRQFRFVLGPDMKPMVKDADGKVKLDLPKPGMKDDAEKANEAVAAWKLMKKQIKEVANLQALRLEQAMVTGRRWPVADFETLLVKHPLMIHLVRLLLWGGYDASGKLTSTFRVTEDQTFADANDAAFVLKGIDTVGVVHPLHLTDERKNTWGEVFSDYEIVPPFSQLGRSIHRLEKDEAKADAITRFDGVKLPAPTLVFGLEKFGWTRGAGMDAGGFDEHSKPFPGSNITAVVTYDGAVGYGYIDPDSTLTMGRCYFVKGIRGASGYNWNEKGLELGKVDPVAVSEVLNELGTLAAKAK